MFVFDYFQDGCLLAVAYWINHHQALIAGVFALVAAWITACYLRNQIAQTKKQIAQTKTHRDDDLRRRHLAAKAGMAMALTEISDYCENCLRNNFEAYAYWKQHKKYVGFKSPNLPAFPREAFDRIQSVTATASQGSPQIILDFLCHAQIHNSRFKNFFFGNGMRYNVGMEEYQIEQIYNSISLFVYTRRFYGYSRRETEEIAEFDSANSAINNCSEALDKWDISDEVKEYVEQNWPPKKVYDRD